MDVSNLNLPKCSFILAVSGGIDSMVLLDIVRRSRSPDTFVVAHFMHGIRAKHEGEADVRLIQTYCDSHGLRLEIGRAGQGELTSENAARQARYAFLHEVRDRYGFKMIVTAHHAGDALETAIINILRGTGPRGLAALRSTQELQRPLLAYTRRDIETYATENHISWHEDSTNADERYLRNYIRRRIVPRLAEQHADETLLALINEQRERQVETDELLLWLQGQLNFREVSEGVFLLNRRNFINLDYSLSCAVIHFCLGQTLRAHDLRKDRIAKLVVFLKTAKTGKQWHINQRYQAVVSSDEIRLQSYSN